MCSCVLWIPCSSTSVVGILRFSIYFLHLRELNQLLTSELGPLFLPFTSKSFVFFLFFITIKKNSWTLEEFIKWIKTPGKSDSSSNPHIISYLRRVLSWHVDDDRDLPFHRKRSSTLFYPLHAIEFADDYGICSELTYVSKSKKIWAKVKCWFYWIDRCQSVVINEKLKGKRNILMDVRNFINIVNCKGAVIKAYIKILLM